MLSVLSKVDSLLSTERLREAPHGHSSLSLLLVWLSCRGQSMSLNGFPPPPNQSVLKHRVEGRRR